MQISVTFKKLELILIARALTYGIIHGTDDEAQLMKELEQKINALAVIYKDI